MFSLVFTYCWAWWCIVLDSGLIVAGWRQLLFVLPIKFGRNGSIWENLQNISTIVLLPITIGCYFIPVIPWSAMEWNREEVESATEGPQRIRPGSDKNLKQLLIKSFTEERLDRELLSFGYFWWMRTLKEIGAQNILLLSIWNWIKQKKWETSGTPFSCPWNKLRSYWWLFSQVGIVIEEILDCVGLKIIRKLRNIQVVWAALKF